MNITFEIAATVASVMWPMVTLIILIAFRKDIQTLVNGIASRVKKLDFAGISLELAEAKSLTHDWASNGLDFRHQAAAMQISDSYSRTFSELLLETSSSADYDIVDLGTGKEWLTSRLYILSIILAHQKGIRAFVFVETAHGVRKRFVGWSSPDSIRWHSLNVILGWRQPLQKLINT